MKCPKCGKELKDGAKFCGGCGTKIEAAADAGTTKCPNCGKELKPGAKFCGGCGTKIEAGAASTKAAGSESSEKGFFRRMMDHIRKRDSDSNDSTGSTTTSSRSSGGNSGGRTQSQNQEVKIDREDIEVSGTCLHWNVLPGQLAVKIDYKTLEGCGKVKGIIIQDGTKALAFANGSFIGELPGGKYKFKNLSPQETDAPATTETKKAGYKRVISGLKGFFKNESAQKKMETENTDIAFVIIRDAMFPLLFEFENIVTGPVTSNKVALHALAKIKDVNSFYRELLLDKQFVCFDSIAQNLNALCKTAIEQSLRDKSPDQIGTEESIETIKNELAAKIATVFPFIDVHAVVRVTAENDELIELRAMREELYISEEKLIELQKRNDYLNRLTDENNAQILREAQTQADFTAAMDKIDEQNLLTDDEKARFAMTLHAQRTIREAQSNDQIQAAMQELQKAGILRAAEIEDLAHKIAQNNQLRDLSDTQAINLVTLQNERALDEEKLAWEIEVGTKRIENQLERQRLLDEYNDSRREADAAFEDSRRRAQINLDKEEQMGQLDLLRQAQAIRQEREDAEHKREMDKLEAARLVRKDELDADLAKINIYAGMTAEQIMAANPNIAPAAAAALAAKFSNDNAVEAQRQINEAQKQSNEQMMGMMQQFMSQMQADKNADREQQMLYMQMMANQNNTQMQQMSSMASNIAAGTMQQTEARLKDKDAEIARIDNASEKHQDRMLNAVETTVKTIPQMKMPTVNVNVSSVCPNCGAKNEEGSSFCGECGAGL